ncbi:hypothetical protein PMM47T1_01615 [Pseudomonas sp. M47T1]|uniref:hypothetical protein n=1 Tax=Pseudomonas sp. M47T1 TaxID=1179778 RepID=UPI0002606AE3|nr:hypothetical protein [Pseudomonas sp. M47T1]EIK98695.1 hypothetical protein PMM47T1_01615 [Pseudomonas sp. M47T1]
MRRLLPCLALLIAGMAAADEPFIVGTATHLMDGSPLLAKNFELASQAGITSVREDAYWARVEQQPGQLQIPPIWRQYNAARAARGMANVVILDYGNQYYENNALPRTPNLLTAFGTYVDYVTRALAGQVSFYEIWNEWDLTGPADRQVSDDYIALVKATTSQIRHNDAKARVLAGAVTSEGLDKGFADRLVEGGVTERVDGLSLHPYVHCRGDLGKTPESWIKWLSSIDQRLTRLAGKPVPLYLTEMSWPSANEPCGVDEATQAQFLARAFFLAKTRPNIKGMWWYDLVNDGTDAKEREHNFGLLKPDLTAKPAYAVLKAIAPILTQYRYDSLKSLQADNLYLLNFAKGDDQLLVAWAVGRPRQVKIEANGRQQGPVQSLDTRHPERGRATSGQWLCPKAEEEHCTTVITLDDFPRIISLGNASWLFTR